MKSWTSILAAIYYTLATFRDLEPDPNACQKGVDNASGTAEPPYQKTDLNLMDFVPMGTARPQNPPKIQPWPPTASPKAPKVSPKCPQVPIKLPAMRKTDYK